MNFILKTMDGNRFKITQEEYLASLKGDGLLVFKSCGVTINKSRIESIFPETLADEIEDRKTQLTGVLHDGTRVKRHFGEWVDCNMVPDDRGSYVPVKLDPVYYPEIASDSVLTEKEFEKIKMLPVEERKAIVSKSNRTKALELAPLKSLLEAKYDRSHD